MYYRFCEEKEICYCYLIVYSMKVKTKDDRAPQTQGF